MFLNCFILHEYIKTRDDKNCTSLFLTYSEHLKNISHAVITQKIYFNKICDWSMYRKILFNKCNGFDFLFFVLCFHVSVTSYYEKWTYTNTHWYAIIGHFSLFSFTTCPLPANTLLGSLLGGYFGRGPEATQIWHLELTTFLPSPPS